MLSGLEEALLKEDKSEALEIINEYYEGLGKDPIFSLDHVARYHETKDLAKKLDFEYGSSSRFRQKLIDLDILPTDLKRYSEKDIEKIAEINIENISKNGRVSWYLTKENSNLEENRKTFAQTKAFKEYLESKGIISLDHIFSKDINKGFTSTLGLEKQSPKILKQKLIDLEVFSTDLKQYSEKEVEEIARARLINMSIPGHTSWYLIKENPHLEENRKIFAKTKAFKKYLEKEGITSLDHINVKQIIAGFKKTLGLNHGDTILLKKKLVDFGVFSTDLKEYSTEEIEEISEIAFKSMTSNATSEYVTKENPHLEENRKIFAQTKAFKEYLKKEGITSLDHINSEHATTGFGSVLGVKSQNTKKLRQKLIDLDVFSTNLKAYSNEEIEKIAEINIESFGKNFASQYLKKANPHLEENRKTFAHTNVFKKYLEENRILSLDHVIEDHATYSLASTLGFNSDSPNHLKKRLIELDIHSPNLNNYSKQEIEEIAEIIIDKINKTKWQSGYFSDYINQEDLEQNKQTILKTQTVQKYLAQENINLKDSKTIKTKKAKNFFKKILGINVDENNLENKLKKIFKKRDTEYKTIKTSWSDDEETMLHDICNNYDNEEDLRFELNQNKEKYQEMFGRSINAIKIKLGHMGILEKQRQFSEKEGRDIERYPFPQIHKEEFEEYVPEFKNLAYLLNNNIMPNVIPVFGFDSAVHEQFAHTTLPVKFKGIDIMNYTPAEQELISYTMNYISDNTDFETKENGDLDGTKIFPHTEPNILSIYDDKEEYIQLIFRKQFNPNNKTETAAIHTDNTEIWYLKHEQMLTYEETRV